MSVFDRITYDEPTRAYMKFVWDRYRDLESMIERDFTVGRERSLALTKLQESLFWLEAAMSTKVRDLSQVRVVDNDVLVSAVAFALGVEK